MKHNLNNNQKKKSQMNLEVIMVLFIFIIMVGVGFAIKFKMDKANLSASVSEKERQLSVDIAKKVAFLPEIACSTNAIVEKDCYDILKLKSMQELLYNNSEINEQEIINNYFEKFGYGNITFKVIYPQNVTIKENENYQNITIYFFAKKKSGNFYYDTKYKTIIPATIHNPLTNENYLGLLIIETYNYFK